MTLNEFYFLAVGVFVGIWCCIPWLNEYRWRVLFLEAVVEQFDRTYEP